MTVYLVVSLAIRLYIHRIYYIYGPGQPYACVKAVDSSACLCTMPMPITHTTSALRKLTTYSFRVAAYAKAANLKCQLVYDAMGSNSKSEVGYCLLFNLIKYL
jgi:hypothetical protein